MRIVWKWGAVLAASLSAWTLIIHLLGIYTFRIEYADMVDQIVIIVPIVVLVLALLEQRRNLGGGLPIGRGFLTGLGVAIVSAPLFVAFMWGYHHFINPDWISILTAYKQNELAAAGVAPDEIAAQIARLQLGATDRNQLISGLLGSVILGAVLSLVLSIVISVPSRFRKSDSSSVTA